MGDIDYPPYYYRSGEQMSGISFIVASNVAAELGYRLLPHRVPFSRAIYELEKGRGDLIAHLFNTPKRAKQLVFTRVPHLHEALHFFSLTHTKLAYRLHPQDMFGYVLGVVRGYSNGPYIDANKDKFRLDVLNNEKTQIRTLLAGRFPAAIGTKPVIIYHANAMGVRGQLKFLEPAISNEPVFMGFSRRLPNAVKLATEFDEALILFMQTQEYRDLLRRYSIQSPLIN